MTTAAMLTVPNISLPNLYCCFNKCWIISISYTKLCFGNICNITYTPNL